MCTIKRVWFTPPTERGFTNACVVSRFLSIEASMSLCAKATEQCAVEVGQLQNHLYAKWGKKNLLFYE